MWKVGATLALTHFYGSERYKKMSEYGLYGIDFGIEAELNGRTEEQFFADIMKEKALMDEAGIVPYQVHGPFRYPIHDETEELRAGRMALMRRSIRAAAMMGVKNWVIHPMFPFGEGNFWPEEVWRINEEFFRSLLPTAKECGVTICLENMPMKKFPIATPEQILNFIHTINDDNFKFCLDTGHAAVFGISPADAVRMAGNDLRAIHVHDNDGKGDRHFVPYSGVIDWADFVKALRENNFNGVFSLESDFNNFIPNAPVDTKMKALMAIVGDMLAE